MTATNPTHAWQTSTSPAEMVRMVGGADGPMRERLAKWAHELYPEMNFPVEWWADPSRPWGVADKQRATALLRCCVPAPRTCPACEGRKRVKDFGSHGYEWDWVDCPTCSATGIICEPPAIDPRWLSGTVCDLARIVRFGDMEERLCPNCDGSRKATGVISRRPVKLGKKECKPCQGVGKRTMRTLKPRFDLMPFLADALMDSGADDESIIAHLQDDKFHCSDCWAIKVLNAAR